MYAFELTTIASFYHAVMTALPAPIIDHMHHLTLKYFDLLLPQLSHLEILKCLKFLLYNRKLEPVPSNLSDQQWQLVLEQFER